MSKTSDAITSLGIIGGFFAVILGIEIEVGVALMLIGIAALLADIRFELRKRE